MRISFSLLLLAAAVAAVVVLVSGEEEDASAEDARTLTLVGDSLNVGTDPLLRELVPRWEIDAHDRVGRTTSEGIEVLRERRRSLAPIVVVSLGTNDPDGAETEFAAQVDEAIRLVGPERCLVWATVVRDGAPRAGFNAVLEQAREAHRNVRLVDWAALVVDDPSLLAPDLVHGTPDGYARRAAETERVVRSCPTRSAT
jgi:lysophospholipase L1-like esterase